VGTTAVDKWVLRRGNLSACEVVSTGSGCMQGRFMAKAWLAKSAAVLVYAQKYGGLSAQPIGKVKGSPMRCCPLTLPGRRTANSNAACGERGTR